MKCCTNKNCKQQNPQPKSNFRKTKRASDGLHWRCKSCDKEYYDLNREHIRRKANEWAINNPERAKFKSKEWRSKNRDICKVIYNNYKNRNPDRIKGYQLKYRYLPELSWQEALDIYNKLKNEQNNKCAICNKEETKVNSKTKLPQDLSLDHDHKSGKIRGLLCSHCNLVYGLIREDPIVLHGIREYHKKWNEFKGRGE